MMLTDEDQRFACVKTAFSLKKTIGVYFVQSRMMILFFVYIKTMTATYKFKSHSPNAVQS